MEHLILNITDKKKIPFLMELLKRLEFVEVMKPSKYSARERAILSGLEEAVEQVKLHKEGKIKLKTIQEVLDEL